MRVTTLDRLLVPGIPNFKDDIARRRNLQLFGNVDHVSKRQIANRFIETLRLVNQISMGGVCTSCNESWIVIFMELEIFFRAQSWQCRKVFIPSTFAPFLTRTSNCPSTAVNVKELDFVFPIYPGPLAVWQVAHFSFHPDNTVIDIPKFEEFIGSWNSLKMTVQVRASVLFSVSCNKNLEGTSSSFKWIIRFQRSFNFSTIVSPLFKSLIVSVSVISHTKIVRYQ
jgi:hypothetical protein